MFEVGKTYKSKGNDHKCICVRGNFAWLISASNSPAYVWDMTGKSLSLSDEYNIKLLSPRDAEVEELKSRIEELEALLTLC